MFKLCSLLQLEGAQWPCLIRFIKSLTVWKPCSCQQYWCLHRDIGARRAVNGIWQRWRTGIISRCKITAIVSNMTLSFGLFPHVNFYNKGINRHITSTYFISFINLRIYSLILSALGLSIFCQMNHPSNLFLRHFKH